MSVQDLFAAADKRAKSEKAKARKEAEEAIAQHSKEKELKLKACFPSLFTNKNPVERWVMIEPDNSLTECPAAKELAAVIDVDGCKIILYTYYISSYGFVLAVAKYKAGSADCWAKIPDKTKTARLTHEYDKYEESLAEMICQLMQED